MFYVYSGYVCSDRYDCSEGDPIYSIKEFSTEKEVIDWKKDFEEQLYECDHIIFRVFRGTELKLKPKKIVEEWELSG